MTVVLLIGTLFGTVGYYLMKDNKTEIQQINLEKLADDKISNNSEDNKIKNEIDISNWKTYRNDEFKFEFKYPLELSFETIPGYVFVDIPDGEPGSQGVKALHFRTSNENIFTILIYAVEQWEKYGNKNNNENYLGSNIVGRSNLAYIVAFRDSNNKSVIDQILSTFKFIEENESNSCSKEGDLSVLARSAYPSNKARITSTKGNRGGSVNFPHRTFLIMDPDFVLEGVNVPEVNRITVEWDGDKATKQVQNFMRGNTHWCFDINEKIGNIMPGVNIYTVKLFLDKDEIIEYGVQVIYDTYSSVILDNIIINIDWFSEIKKEPVENLFSQDVLDNFYTDCNYNLSCYNLFSFYKAGSVRSGKYKDYDYYLVSRTFIGHGSSDDYYRAIFNPSEKKLILLEKYSNEPSGEDKPFFTVAENITVENLLPKKEILIPNSSYYLEAHEESPNILFSKMISIEHDKSKKIFTDPEAGDVYMEDKTKTFFVKVPDGSLKIYRIKLPFVKSREKSEDWNYDDLLLDITFTDGKANTENYFHGSRYQFVCAGGDMYDIVPEKDLNPEKNLRLLGTSSNGEEFYEFKSNKLKEYYENTNSLSGIRYHINDDIFFEQFESFHPLIFWKDPFGRWVQFTNNRLSSMAECGGGLSNSAI